MFPRVVSVLSVLILASIFWVGAFEGVGFKNNDSKIFRINGVTTSVSLYAFCYCAQPVFPTLYTSMKNKRQFSNCVVLLTITGKTHLLLLFFLAFFVGEIIQNLLYIDFMSSQLCGYFSQCCRLFQLIGIVVVITGTYQAIKDFFGRF
ncbi:hypothetical protein YC2023_119806 [Brassica napus]